MRKADDIAGAGFAGLRLRPSMSGCGRGGARGVVGGTSATATLNPAGDHNNILVTAKAAGIAGNDLSASVVIAADSTVLTAVRTGDNVEITSGDKRQMIVTGTISLALAGQYTFQAIGFPGPAYDRWADFTGFSEIRWNDTTVRWEVREGSLDTVGYYSESATATPDLATGWTPFGSPLPTGTPIVTSATATAAQAITLINATGALPISAANAAANDGTGALATVAAVDLTGGAD